MAYRGRKQQGEEVTLGVLCADAAGSPAAPDAAPTVSVYGPPGLVLAGKALPVLDRYGTGVLASLFQWNLFLAEAYVPGVYHALYSWTTGAGAFAGGALDSFEVVQGGDPKGAVLSLYHWQRPHAAFVLQGLDSGRLARNRSPRL
jgi:hypothetical protein